MNMKLMFWGCAALGILPTLAGLGDVKEASVVSRSRSTEHRELQREGIDRSRASSAALKWADTCQPVYDETTKTEFVFAEGMEFVSNGTGQRINGDLFVCNSLGYVGKVEGGFVTEVLQIKTEDMAKYMEIFNVRLNQQVSTSPQTETQQSLPIESEPRVDPNPYRNY